MTTLKTKFFLFLFVLAAFIGPFAAVIAVEKSKRAEMLAIKEEEMVAAQKEAAEARYQYYLDSNDRKNNLKQAMVEAKVEDKLDPPPLRRINWKRNSAPQIQQHHLQPLQP